MENRSKQFNFAVCSLKQQTNFISEHEKKCKFDSGMKSDNGKSFIYSVQGNFPAQAKKKVHLHQRLLQKGFIKKFWVENIFLQRFFVKLHFIFHE